VPLVRITSDRRWMGSHANPRWVRRAAWAVTVLDVALGTVVVWETIA
jgi:Mn2+/Fe2+ NRAMP family transporter